jgi:hypothetical protein
MSLATGTEADPLLHPEAAREPEGRIAQRKGALGRALDEYNSGNELYRRNHDTIRCGRSSGHSFRLTPASAAAADPDAGLLGTPTEAMKRERAMIRHRSQDRRSGVAERKSTVE